MLGLKVRRQIRGELKWRYFAPANNDARNPMRNLDQATRDAIWKTAWKSDPAFGVNSAE
jgi:hypothetical protein